MKTKNKSLIKAFHDRLSGIIYYMLSSFPSAHVRLKADVVRLKLELAEDPKDLEGYTDGSLIFAKSINRFLPGLVMHELGHILFTWFRGNRLLVEGIKNGDGIHSDLIHKDLSSWTLGKIQDELQKDSKWANYFAKSFMNFSNIVEDGHLERLMLTVYSNVLSSSLVSLRDYMWNNDIPSVKELQEKVDSEEFTQLMATFALFLSYGKYGKVKRDSNAELSLDVIHDFRGYSDEYIKIVKTPNKVERYKLSLKFVLENIYDLIKEEYEKMLEKEEESKNDGSPTPSSTGGSTEESEDAESGAEGDPIPGSSKAPTGHSPFEDSDIEEDMSSGSSDGPDEERHEAIYDEGYSEDSEVPKMDSNEGGRIDNSVEGMASSEGLGENDESVEQAEKDMDDFIERIEELARKEELNAKADDESKESTGDITDTKITGVIAMDSGAHNGVSASIRIARDEESAYERVFQTVEYFVKDTSKRLKAIFESLKRDYTKKGLWYGGRINTRRAYRPDVGFYERKIVSDPRSDLALFIMVDESGSMSSRDRIPAAVRATVLLDAVAREIDVPCAIYGHTEELNVVFYKYRDFDDPESRKYSLPSISARANNRDGYALKFAYEKLRNRKEEKKLLIIISDGQPAANCYGGQSAIRDMQSIIASYKDINVVAAAIGNDQQVIEEIYGSKNFLDCSDLSTLGDKLVKILQKASFR